MGQNFYEILGVTRNASKNDIAKSYRKLALQYHPDVNPNGTSKFKLIAEAYETLNDDIKRSQYNARIFKGIEVTIQKPRRPSDMQIEHRDTYPGQKSSFKFYDAYEKQYEDNNQPDIKRFKR